MNTNYYVPFICNTKQKKTKNKHTKKIKENQILKKEK